MRVEGPKFAHPIENKVRSKIYRFLTQKANSICHECGAHYSSRTKRRSATDWFLLVARGHWQLIWFMKVVAAKPSIKHPKMMYADPQTLHLLLDKVADSGILYLNAQIKAGAQAVMVFDTWGRRVRSSVNIQTSLCNICIKSSMV